MAVKVKEFLEMSSAELASLADRATARQKSARRARCEGERRIGEPARSLAYGPPAWTDQRGT